VEGTGNRAKMEVEATAPVPYPSSNTYIFENNSLILMVQNYRPIIFPTK
jgi:hypothetical protein